MSIFKCKMCGGDLNITEGQTVCECEYCGTSQTVPTLDSEKKTSLFTKANKFRFDCEFDKAAVLYEEIISDFPEEAEAYWGLVLSRYGIEYVEDPESHIRIPTVHRAQYKSIFEDENYRSALAYSDTYQKTIYERQAAEIDTAQKGILDISKSESPYDIFICYKESDKNGQRTEDSVLAYDIYDKLTEKGYKVFFSRVTLDSKIGREYEPYIFSALNSAKVMLVVGTKPEYFDAVWVKNEWKRYLEIVKKDSSKTIIPCYKGMNPQYLPDELKNIQSVDMSKIGYIQDLVIGINKLLNGAGNTESMQSAEKKPAHDIKKIIIPAAVIAVIIIAVIAVSALKSGKSETDSETASAPVSSAASAEETEKVKADDVPTEEEVSKSFIEYYNLVHKWFYETTVDIDYDTTLDTENVVVGDDYSESETYIIHPVNDGDVKTLYDLDKLFLSYCTKDVYESFYTVFGTYKNYDGKLCISCPDYAMGYEGSESLIESSVEVKKVDENDFEVSYEVIYSGGQEGVGDFIVHYTKTSEGYRFGEAYSDNSVSKLDAGTYRVTTQGSSLMVRQLPDKNSDKVDTIANGFVVMVVSSSKEWAYIEYYPSQGKVLNGWVSVDYLIATTDKMTNAY